MKKTFLVLLVIACLVAAGWIGYSLFTDKPEGETEFATVEDIWVGRALFVQLKPTNSALPDYSYMVELYENGVRRDTTRVSWNQQEINVLEVKTVLFPITESEFDAYFFEEVSHIFTVKVCE